jgi:hypothetical protein
MVSIFWTAAGMGLPDSVDVKYPDGSINYWVVLYFASFILVLNWTLLQVQRNDIIFIRRNFCLEANHNLKHVNDVSPANMGFMLILN